MTSTIDAAAAKAATSLSELADAIFTAESSADTQFVKAQASNGGVSATALTRELAACWEAYAVVKAVGDDLQTSITTRNKAVAERLLGPAAVNLPDGTATDISTATTQLAKRVAALSHDVSGLAEQARAAITKLEEMTAATRDVEQRARAAGCAADVELESLRATLEGVTSGLTRDPFDPRSLQTLESALAKARTRVESLEASQRAVPDELVAADALLAEIESVVAAGRDAHARTIDRIATPSGLMTPLELAADEHALRPWLARLHEQADGQAWGPAHVGLTEWRKVADAWMAKARRVLDANRAPLAHRDELRGLLDGYQAKAAASGAGEDADLGAQYRAAHDLLHSKPCDLQTADALVRAYIDAVNGAIGPAQR